MAANQETVKLTVKTSLVEMEKPVNLTLVGSAWVLAGMAFYRNLGVTYNGTTGRLSAEVIKGSNFRNMAMNRRLVSSIFCCIFL